MSAGDERSKRHLRLMTEVLPEPDRASETGPRARTLAHMHRLLAVAAAAGALGTACTKEATNDTINTGDPSKDRTAVDPSAAGTTTPPAQNTVATASGETTSGPPGGYAVVDPLPPPAQCAGAAETVAATATWKASGDGGVAIEVRLRKPSNKDFAYSRKSKVTPYDATIVATSMTGGDLVVTIVPDKGETSVGIYVPIDCPPRDGSVTVQIDLSGAPSGTKPSPGTAVKVSVYDRS
jgi:hypothetical protein